MSMKVKKPILDRGQKYKFINFWILKGATNWMKEPSNLAVIKSAFAVYCEGSASSIPTLDKRFCDHMGKKCNGADKLVAIESIQMFASLSHTDLKPIRAHYSITNETIMRACNGRPKEMKASVGDKITQLAQVDNLMNDLFKLCGKASRKVDYIGGKLSATDTSNEFLKAKKVIIKAHDSLNDSRELKLLNDAHRINEGVNKGMYNGVGALIPKKDRKTVAPATAPINAEISA